MADRFIEDVKPKFNIAELKAGGFIKQRQKDLFTIRLRCPGGRIDANVLAAIGEIANKYGRGMIHTSVRQSIEIPYVNIDDFDAVVAELDKVGMKVASCGPRVRVPIACGGCEYNPNGLTDTVYFADEVDKRYFGRPCHHKFKMSFSGCPIDCVRARQADLGFQGMMEPVWDPEPCIACTLCAQACREGAIVAGEDRRPIYDPTKCINCGDCVRVCPSEAWTAKRVGHTVRVGGKHGRHPLESIEVAEFVGDEQVFDVIEKTLEWYNANGRKGERIGATLRRVGVDNYKQFMRDIFDGSTGDGGQA